MHETAIAKQTLDLALSSAKAAGAARILEIRMSIGALSGVVPNLLENALSELARGTPAEGALLRTQYVPPRLLCADCGQESEGIRGLYTCPFCGSAQIRLIGGSGYRIDDLLVE